MVKDSSFQKKFLYIPEVCQNIIITECTVLTFLEMGFFPLDEVWFRNLP